MTINHYEHGSIFMAAVGDLVPDRDQARKYFCPEAHAELTKTVAAYGISQLITVTRVDGELQIVSGERRWRAAKAAGLEFVQVKFVDQNVSAISLIENLQRENLLPIEKAEGLLRLKEQHGFNHEQLAGMIGKSVPTVCEILALTRLPDDIRAECAKSKYYVHSRLLIIAKAPNSKAMRKQFLAYKSELDGTTLRRGQRAKSKQLDGLISRISGMITQIAKIGIDPLNKVERTCLFNKLNDLEIAIQGKSNSYRLLESSEFRSGYDESLVTVVDGAEEVSVSENIPPAGSFYVDLELFSGDSETLDSDLNVEESPPIYEPPPLDGVVDTDANQIDSEISNQLIDEEE